MTVRKEVSQGILENNLRGGKQRKLWAWENNGF